MVKLESDAWKHHLCIILDHLGYLEICPFYSGNYGRVDVLGLTLAEYHTYRYSLSVAYLNVVSSVHVSESI